MNAGRFVLVLAITASINALGAPVAAQPKQPTPPPPPSTICEHFEIAATTDKNLKVATFDAELKPVEKKLKKKPFTSWNTFKVLSHGTKTLVRNTSEALPLKSGKASVMLADLVDKSKVRLNVQADDPAGKRWVDTKVVVEAADYVVWVRDMPNDAGYLLALTCK